MHELSFYPCLRLSKDDLTGYFENEYSEELDERLRAKVSDYLNNLDHYDLYNIAYEIPSDQMMESFWIKIHDYITNIIEENKQIWTD